MTTRRSPATTLALCLLSAVLIASIASPAGADGAEASAVAVLDSDRAEMAPAVNETDLGWSENMRMNPDWFNTYLDPACGPKMQVNPQGTLGFSGGMDDSRFAHQVVSRKGSDVRLLDLASLDPVAVPSGEVNTPDWEWNPHIDGDWLLFGRNNIGDAKRPYQRIILYNLDTDEKRILASVRGKANKIYPGGISGNYVTWDDCIDECDTNLYDIALETSTPVAAPGANEWTSAVTADGTVYYGQEDGGVCESTQMIRDPLAGPPVALVTLPSGTDTSWGATRVNADTSVDYFFDRYKCTRKFPMDIFMIEGADTAPAESASDASPSAASDLPAGLERPVPLGASAPGASAPGS